MIDITQKIDGILDEGKPTYHHKGGDKLVFMKVSKNIPKEFMEDPLYKAVVTSKDRKSYDKALKTLLSIRGRGAVDALKHAMGKK